jgi:hypothetical protein
MWIVFPILFEINIKQMKPYRYRNPVLQKKIASAKSEIKSEMLNITKEISVERS